MEPTRLDAPGDVVELCCPRCRQEVEERFYGPCGACRAELRATMGTEGHELTSEAYVPKMNVTPNAVASKD